MPTQRLTLLKIVGDAGRAVADRCREWSVIQKHFPNDTTSQQAVGRLAESLVAHSTELPVVYSVEWIDRWLMGNTIAEPFKTRGLVLNAGERFDTVCVCEHLESMLSLPDSGWQHDEQAWLASRLREAATAWQPLVGGVLVLVREVLGPSVEDDEVLASARGVPGWLADGLGS